MAEIRWEATALLREKRLNYELRAELLRLQEDDLTLRRELIDAGELYGPHLPKDFYHPKMAELHRRNNARLSEIIKRFGWPGNSMVGEDGGEAAWKVAQHAILNPQLQQRCVALLEASVQAGEAPAWQCAMLTDRVLMERGEPQIYGSIHVGNEAGELVPWPIADPDNVDAKRKEVGLPPLNQNTQRLQKQVHVEQSVQYQAHKAKSTTDAISHTEAP